MFIYCFCCRLFCFVLRKCVGEIQLVLCVVILSEVTRNASDILPTAWSEFITSHFTSSAVYALCKRTLNLGTASKSLQRSHTITHFWMPLSPAPSPSPSSSAQPELCAASVVSHSSDIKTIFGSTPTLKVEVPWLLNTIAKHFGNRVGC